MNCKKYDPALTDDLYEGNAKSAKGFLAGVLFQIAKDEGCHVEIN